MTTLLMVQTPDDVIIGWDALVTTGNESFIDTAPKFFVNNGVVYGVAGTNRASDIVETVEFPAHDPEKYPNPRHWIIKEWVPVMRNALDGEPGLTTEEGGLSGWSLLMVVGGVGFNMDGLLNPSSSREGIYKAGSGGDFAWGALVYAKNAGHLDEYAVMDALAVAASIDPFTGGDLTVTFASDYIRGANEQD